MCSSLHAFLLAENDFDEAYAQFDLGDDDLRSLMGRSVDTAAHGETDYPTGQESRSTVAAPQLV